MKIKGFELKERSAYMLEVVSGFSGGNRFLYAKALYDSISINWNWFTRIFLYRWKFPPKNIMKSYTERQLLEAYYALRKLEKAEQTELIFHEVNLGLKTWEDVYKLFNVKNETEFIEYVKASKKKVETLSSM